MGDLFETWVEDFDAATWRIQRDDADLQLPHTDKKVIEKGGPPWYDGEIDEDTGVKTRSITVDNGYLRRISMIQPYTDEKGYEVIPAFPWGRYSTLRESLVDCTRSYWYEDSASVKEKTQKEFAKASAFLTGGFAIPGGLPAQVLDEAVATSASNSGASQTATYEETTKLFDKFDKSNVISFELNYENGADYGKSEEDFGAAGAKNARPSGLASDNNPNSGSDSPDNSNIVDKLNVFLLGCTSPSNSNNSGPYAVSLLPQNTDIGGFIPSAGPFSGVIASMSATFTSSPYGALFGMRPTVQNTTSAYFTSGYEDQGNSTNPGAASYSSVGTGNVGWSAFKKQF